MNYDEALDFLLKNTENEKNCNVRIWVGLDGIFHIADYLDNNDNLVCYCGISYSTDTGDCIVTPWSYMEDCPAIFKKSTSTRKMSLFWMNWISKIYGDGTGEPNFETDWLAVKSNRSVLMLLFARDCETLKKELLDEEKNKD